MTNTCNFIYTIGFTKKSAEEFFSLIKKNSISLLIDIRLNNESQLAGFTKARDLPFLLKNLCNCRYVHELDFCPSSTILSNYKKNLISWKEYETQFNALIQKRHIETIYERKYLPIKRTVLLCSESTPEQCHRRLVAEYLKKYFNLSVIHL